MSSVGVTVVSSTQSVQEAENSAELRNELQRTSYAGALKRMYVALRGPGATVGRRLISRLILRLEGGEMVSATMRHIMYQIHGIEIGAHSYGCFDPVRFPSGTRVSRYVSVGPQVEVYRRNHPLDRLSLHPYFYNPNCGAVATADVATSDLEIDAGAWLGARALILPGCRRIGRGAVVAAGAVVTHDVPDYAVFGGNPARLLRHRFDPKAIEAAEHSQWWLSTPGQVARQYETTRPWLESPLAQRSDGHDEA